MQVSRVQDHEVSARESDLIQEVDEVRHRLVLVPTEDADTEHLPGHSGGRLVPHPLEQPVPLVGAVQRSEQYGVAPPGSKPVP